MTARPSRGCRPSHQNSSVRCGQRACSLLNAVTTMSARNTRSSRSLSILAHVRLERSRCSASMSPASSESWRHPCALNGNDVGVDSKVGVVTRFVAPRTWTHSCGDPKSRSAQHAPAWLSRQPRPDSLIRGEAWERARPKMQSGPNGHRIAAHIAPETDRSDCHAARPGCEARYSRRRDGFGPARNPANARTSGAGGDAHIASAVTRRLASCDSHGGAQP